eukprot:3118926-Amphidinium_carterae.1
MDEETRVVVKRRALELRKTALVVKRGRANASEHKASKSKKREIEEKEEDSSDEEAGRAFLGLPHNLPAGKK